MSSCLGQQKIFVVSVLKTKPSKMYTFDFQIDICILNQHHLNCLYYYPAYLTIRLTK